MAKPHQAGQCQTHAGDRQTHQLWEAYCEQSRQLGLALATIAALEYETAKLRQALAEYVREEEP